VRTVTRSRERLGHWSSDGVISALSAAGSVVARVEARADRGRVVCVGAAPGGPCVAGRRCSSGGDEGVRVGEELAHGGASSAGDGCPGEVAGGEGQGELPGVHEEVHGGGGGQVVGGGLGGTYAKPAPSSSIRMGAGRLPSSHSPRAGPERAYPPGFSLDRVWCGRGHLDRRDRVATIRDHPRPIVEPASTHVGWFGATARLRLARLCPTIESGADRA